MNGRNAGLVALTAYASVALHVVGLALAVVALRPGSPLAPIDARVEYLSRHPLGWSVGWGVWILCALALVAFLASVRAWAEPSELGGVALKLALAGAAVDVLCDWSQIRTLTDLAFDARTLATLEDFVRWE